MRKIESSSNTWCSARLMVCALDRSRPSGFSTTTPRAGGAAGAAEPRGHLGEQARRDREVVAGPRRAVERARSAANVASSR